MVGKKGNLNTPMYDYQAANHHNNNLMSTIDTPCEFQKIDSNDDASRSPGSYDHNNTNINNDRTELTSKQQHDHSADLAHQPQ